MKVILAATDFSARADRAVQRAAILARQHGARLFLTHVVDDDQPRRLVDAESEAALALLDEMRRERPELAGIDCSGAIALGDPFDGIVAAARERAADLIVVGSHRRQILRDIFLGTTAERVMRTARMPVLMVAAEAKSAYGLGLAAIDFSDWSRHAFATARGLGFFDRTRLVVLHAYEALAKGVMFYANVESRRIADYSEEIATLARRETSDFIHTLPLDGLDYTVMTREGSPAKTICDVADQIHADFIVMGSHGRTPTARVFLGSVAEEVLRRAAYDVLVVARPA